MVALVEAGYGENAIHGVEKQQDSANKNNKRQKSKGRNGWERTQDFLNSSWDSKASEQLHSSWSTTGTAREEVDNQDKEEGEEDDERKSKKKKNKKKKKKKKKARSRSLKLYKTTTW